MKTRRDFLAGLAAFAAAAVLDPERLLWVSGQKTIFVPPAVVKPEYVAYNLDLTIEFKSHDQAEKFRKQWVIHQENVRKMYPWAFPVEATA